MEASSPITRHNAEENPPGMLDREARLRQIERALQFDEDPERRKQLRREFLDLTDKRTMA